MEESSLTQTQELKLLKNCSGLQFSSFLIFFPFQNLKARKEYAIPHATLQQTLSLKKKNSKKGLISFLKLPRNHRENKISSSVTCRHSSASSVDIAVR